MITIKVIGLDQFVVADLSKECGQNIANIYEVSSEDVNFVAPNCMIFHDGVEQTSWHVIIDVMAPKKVSVLQEQVALYLHEVFKEVAINIEIIFHYYSSDDRVLFTNDDYPRYISESNEVRYGENYEGDEVEDECEDEHCSCHHHHEEEEEIYTGNVFEEFDKIVSKK